MRTQPSRAAVASMEPSGDTARAFRPFRLASNTAAGILPLLPLPASLWLSSSIMALACTHIFADHFCYSTPCVPCSILLLQGKTLSRSFFVLLLPDLL